MKLTKKDLEWIISAAQKEYSEMPIPYHLNEPVEGNKCVNLAMVIATVSFLSKKGVLNENVETYHEQTAKDPE